MPVVLMDDDDGDHDDDQMFSEQIPPAPSTCNPHRAERPSTAGGPAPVPQGRRVKPENGPPRGLHRRQTYQSLDNEKPKPKRCLIVTCSPTACQALHMAQIHISKVTLGTVGDAGDAY